MQLNICLCVCGSVCMHVHAYILNAACAKRTICRCSCTRNRWPLGLDSDTLQVLFTGLLTELSLASPSPLSVPHSANTFCKHFKTETATEMETATNQFARR